MLPLLGVPVGAAAQAAGETGVEEAGVEDAGVAETGVAETGVAETETETPVPEAPPPTEAELEDARHAFEVGAAAFENGDYESASTEFRTAHELSRHPALLYNIYLAEERAGRPGEAALMLERYLETEVPTPEERTLLERRLERLRTRAMSRGVVVDPAENESDRAALIARPTDADGSEWVLPTSTPTGPPAAGVALLVTGGVLLATFAVLAPLSEVEDQRLAGSCGRSAGRSCTSDETSTLLALNVAADVSWISGGVIGAVGLVLLFALPPEGGTSTEPSVAVLPVLGPSYAGLSLGGRF